MSRKQFIAWMRRNYGGSFYSFYPCWVWRIGGILVTFWWGSGLVKIYHDEGRRTECYPVDINPERCRKAVTSLSFK